MRELPIADWVPLSKRIRIMCLPDYNQDDADMINFFDEAGNRIAPLALQRKRARVPPAQDYFAHNVYAVLRRALRPTGSPFPTSVADPIGLLPGARSRHGRQQPIPML